METADVAWPRYSATVGIVSPDSSIVVAAPSVKPCSHADLYKSFREVDPVMLSSTTDHSDCWTVSVCEAWTLRTVILCRNAAVRDRPYASSVTTSEGTTRRGTDAHGRPWTPLRGLQIRSPQVGGLSPSARASATR